MLAAALPAWGQLSATSPFQSPQAPGAALPTTPPPLEFAGYMSTSEGLKYVVRDPAKKISSFLKINETDPNLGVVVKQHDMGQNTLTVEYQGKPLTLEVRKARIISSGNPAMLMPPQPMPQPVVANVAPAVTQSVVVNPSPADEQKRLEAVAAEVARRRALREQAAQPGQPAPAGPVAIPATPPQATNALQIQR
jgi:hypothetical protein